LIDWRLLMYAISEDLREWFLKQETALFKYRFEQETMEEKKRFLQYLNLNWKIVGGIKRCGVFLTCL
jgi:DNA primase large subunit